MKGLKKVENTSVFIEIEERNNRVQIEAHNRNQNISLHIKVPFNSHLKLENHRGSGITISNVHGNIEVESHSGPIYATGVRGSIVAESSSSDLTVIFDQFNTKKPSSLVAHRGNVDITLPKKASVEIIVKNYDGELYSGIAAEFKSVDKIENDKSSKRQRITIGGTLVAKLNDAKQVLSINTYRSDIYIRSK